MTFEETLQIFQKTHPLKHINITGHVWEYIVTGKGKETIFMIHGGTGSAESIFRYTTELEDDYCVITPTIPTEITTVKETVVGLEAILEIEKKVKFHAIGFSLGGMVEQVFLRKHREQVKSLVLFHCPAPSKSYADFIARTITINQIMPSWLPGIMGKLYMKREFSKQYSNIAKEEREFWINYYTQHSSKARTVNQMKIVLDFLRHYHFVSNDLAKWKGKVYIFETVTDTMIPKIERDRLKQIYPQAKVHSFSEGSHLGNGLFQVDTTVTLFKDFLAET